MNYPICISELWNSTFMHSEHRAIWPGGQNISGSTYQNSQMANQSTRFVGVRWSSWAYSYVATVAIGRSKRKNEYSSTNTKTDNVDDETFSD